MYNEIKQAITVMTRFGTVRGNEPAGPFLPLACVSVGLTLGALAALWGGFLRLTCAPVAAASVAAVSISILFWWLYQGAGPSALASMIAARATGRDQSQIGMYLSLSAFQLCLLVKFLNIWILVYTEHSAWLLAGPALGALAIADSLSPPPGGGSQPPSPLLHYSHWIVAGLAAALAGMMEHTVMLGLLAAVLGSAAIVLARSRLAHVRMHQMQKAWLLEELLGTAVLLLGLLALVDA